MKKNKCKLTFDVAVRTKLPNGKMKHGKFERGVEDVMKSVFVNYIKNLVKRIPNGENYTWEQKGKNICLVAPVQS